MTRRPNTRIKRCLRGGLIVSATLLLSACNDGGVDASFVPRDAQLRVTHASPDAPPVNVYINGVQQLAEVDYKDSSGILPLAAGDYDIEVRGILPDGTETGPVIGPVTLTAISNERLEVIAGQALASIAPFVVRQPVDNITDVSVTVLHAAPGVGDVDIYITSPGGSFATGTKVDVGFGESAGPLSLLPDGEYQLRIVPDGGDEASVVYDSGTVFFSNIDAGTAMMLIAVENTTGIGDNPVNLLMLNNEGREELFDAETTAEVRAIHMSADTPAVDILVGAPGSDLSAPNDVLLSDVPFKAAANYDAIAAPTGVYNLEVEDALSNLLTPIDVDINLVTGLSYTAIAIGSLNALPGETVEPLVFIDDRRSVATEARLRVVHAAYAVAEVIPVDVYLTGSNDITSASPVISNLAYGEYTDQLPLAGGDYFITVTAAGDKNTVVFGAPLLGAATSIEAGKVYTVIARDPQALEDLGSNAFAANAITLETYVSEN